MTPWLQGASGGGQPLPPKQIQAAQRPSPTELASPCCGSRRDVWSGSTLPTREPSSDPWTPRGAALPSAPRLCGRSWGQHQRRELLLLRGGGAAEGTGAALGRLPAGLSGHPGQESTRNPLILIPNHQTLASRPFQILGSRQRLWGQEQERDGGPWDILEVAGRTD